MTLAAALAVIGGALHVYRLPKLAGFAYGCAWCALGERLLERCR